MAHQRMVVVGGGVMGLATGCTLAAQPDVAVTVLERFQVGHEWASSHGLTRAIRHEYGDATIYTDMVARSLPLWDDLARETGRALYTETGVLTLGHTNDGHTLPGLEVMRARGLPAEAEALALAAFNDVQALLPLARREHYTACLAILCRAERILKRKDAGERAYAALQKAPGRIRALEALALVEDAERQPHDAGGRDRAFALLTDAFERNAPYVLWYFTQPDSFAALRADPRCQRTITAADEREARLATSAPSSDTVALALALAEKEGHSRPAPQSSHAALYAQIATLTATLTLLIWWTWSFFIVGSS